MVYLKQFSSRPYNRREILRYMKAEINSSDLSLISLVDECINECETKGIFANKVCYSIVDLSISDKRILIGDISFESGVFSKKLSDCHEVVLFAATVGIDIDRLVERYSNVSPAKALAFQAIGAERIESLCDAFCEELSDEYITIPRFSPGYGEIPLDLQKDFFKMLNCEKNLGLTLTDSMLMAPTKSVTAIVGIRKKGI